MDLRAWIPQLNPDVTPGTLPLGPDERTVLACVDGSRSITEVLRDSALPAKRAMGALVTLHDLAALQAAPVEVAAALAAFRLPPGGSLPSPVLLDAGTPGAQDDGLLPPPPWDTAAASARGSGFSAVPTETELPAPSAPVPAGLATEGGASARFEESDPTFVEDDDEPLPVPAERTVVDAVVFPPEPEGDKEPEEWGDEPGTLQDSTPPDDDP